MPHAARCKYRTQKIILAPSHNFSGYIFGTKACIDNRKNLLSSNTSSTCSDNMVNFGPLAAEIDPVVWGTPANFNCFASWQRYCTAVKYWAPAKLCGVEQRGHLYSAGRPSRWALAHISSLCIGEQTFITALSPLVHTVIVTSCL